MGDSESGFSEAHKIGNIPVIDKFVFQYVCSFFSLFALKLNVTGWMRIII